MPSQETIQGTLGDIASLARDGEAALLVVGAVAGLREHLRWFDERPLFGKRIVVTRSLEQAGELIEMLEERGAEAIPAPTIRSRRQRMPMRSAGLRRGLDVRLDRVHERQRRRVLHGAPARHERRSRARRACAICTIGPSTASRVAQYGIRVDLTPAEFRAEAVVDALKATGDLTGKRFLLPRADIARDLLADAAARGRRLCPRRHGVSHDAGARRS